MPLEKNDELFEGCFCTILIIEVFLFQEMVEMPKEVEICW